MLGDAVRMRCRHIGTFLTRTGNILATQSPAATLQGAQEYMDGGAQAEFAVFKLLRKLFRHFSPAFNASYSRDLRIGPEVPERDL